MPQLACKVVGYSNVLTTMEDVLGKILVKFVQIQIMGALIVISDFKILLQDLLPVLLMVGSIIVK